MKLIRFGIYKAASIFLIAVFVGPVFAGNGQESNAAKEAGLAEQRFKEIAFGYPIDLGERWDYEILPEQSLFASAVKAVETSKSIEAAILKIVCSQNFAGPVVDIGVEYVLQGGTPPEDDYMLDLFDSDDSGRPAAYNLGGGFVRTDKIHVPLGKDPQDNPDYVRMTRRFWSELTNLSKSDQIVIRFELGRVDEKFVEFVFPTNGLPEMVLEGASICQ